MLKYKVLPVTAFAQNASVVWCDQTQEAAVIDPGGDLDSLLALVDQLGVKLSQIWLTHGHIDHAGGAGELSERLHIPVIGPHLDDRFWLDGLASQSQMFGFPPAMPFEPTRWLQHGDRVTLGQETVEVLHCPGHTPGHVVFVSKTAAVAFVGDVLFAGSIGRTDFPKGNHEQLLQSIRQRLWPLGDDTCVIPGHGPDTTIGDERATNPYVRDR
ncbi:MAG: hypothetical protein RLZZ397_989 [Pseudomonadota bacterium]|jgi:glyoxylase-like metal-dependent hydrolase (beta-lactamase superfamily II)